MWHEFKLGPVGILSHAHTRICIYRANSFAILFVHHKSRCAGLRARAQDVNNIVASRMIDLICVLNNMHLYRVLFQMSNNLFLITKYLLKIKKSYIYTYVCVCTRVCMFDIGIIYEKFSFIMYILA